MDEYLPNNIALEQYLGHDKLIYLIKLAYLCELQCAGRSTEKEAHNDEDGVVENADRNKLGN